MGKAGICLSALGGILLLLGGSGGAWADVIRVKADAMGAGNGTSWSDAYTTLPAALAAAHSGDEIWVAAGVYKPTSDANRALSIMMANGVSIYGGFTGIETARDQRNWSANATILSGDIGTVGNALDNSYRVVTGAQLAVLDGFTITAGNGGSGSGMFNSNCAPTVTNCTFIGNAASDSGAAMYNNNNGSPTVINCSFAGNSATIKGGAIYSRASSLPTVINCTFSGNAAGSGGAMHNDTVSPTVTNCTFIGNTAGVAGGAMYNLNCSPPVNNCIFWDNSAPSGAQIFSLLETLDTPIFSHCDIKGSGGSGDSWDFDLGVDGGGNIDSDPLLKNAAQPAGPDAIWRTGDDGLALDVGSPCINAGLVAGAPASDILGYPRDAAPDMGAYEYGVHRWMMY